MTEKKRGAKYSCYCDCYLNYDAALCDRCKFQLNFLECQFGGYLCFPAKDVGCLFFEPSEMPEGGNK